MNTDRLARLRVPAGLRLPPLSEVEKLYRSESSLAECSRRQRISKTGIPLERTEATMMQKIEELTKYAIQPINARARLSIEQGIGSQNVVSKKWREIKMRIPDKHSYFCTGARSVRQDSINPYNIQQHNTIELHNDRCVLQSVPAACFELHARAAFCQSVALRDSNGINELWPRYQPVVHATGETIDSPSLKNGSHGVSRSENMQSWQRLFQALPKDDGTHTDIIAGGNPGGFRHSLAKMRTSISVQVGRLNSKMGFMPGPEAFSMRIRTQMGYGSIFGRVR